MIASVGIERTSNAAASCCWASVSTLVKRMSSCFSDAFSYTGANWRHGPHQLAQKSIRTNSFSFRVSSKFSAVSSTVLMPCPTRHARREFPGPG